MLYIMIRAISFCYKSRLYNNSTRKLILNGRLCMQPSSVQDEFILRYMVALRFFFFFFFCFCVVRISMRTTSQKYDGSSFAEG